MNSVNIIGHVGAGEIVLRESKGTKVCSFSLAHNKLYKDKASGEWKKITTWTKVVAWGDRAISVANNLKTGDKVAISGELVNEKERLKTLGDIEKDFTFVVIRLDSFSVQDKKDSQSAEPEAADLQEEDSDVPF